MSTSDARTASPSPLTATGFLVDEAALKRAFDAEFPNCLASTKQQLGDNTGAAPRIIETAFLNAWAQRASLTTHEHLKSVLGDEIRHGVARALSRRHAGARFGAVSGGKTAEHAAASAADHETPEYVWSQIDRALHGVGHNAAAHAAVANASRHGAASHLKTVGKRPSWVLPVVIGVIALAISVGGVMYVDRLGEDDAMLAIASSPQIQPIASSAGQIGTTKLGDGTQMRLGPESKVFVPDGFATKNRVVKVEGTATFDVAKGQKMPFRVVAGGDHFIATGTKFTISTFTHDSMPALFVEEGTVTVKAHKAVTTVSANQAVVAESTTVRPATDAEKASLFAWTKNRVTVMNQPLHVAVDIMHRWYNNDVKITDLKLEDRPTTFDAPIDSVAVAIPQIEQSAHVKYATEDGTRVFLDASAAPEKGAKGAKAAKAAKPAAKKGSAKKK